MRLSSLGEELDAITHEFDYGIVPGSATVFVKDEANGIGRLDLTLLEGVMIVLEVTDQGYKVTSCSPLCNMDPALSTAQLVQAHLETPFESMENLLMTISPMFRDRFQQELYNKLQSVQQHQQQQQQQQQQPPSQMLSNNDNPTHLDLFSQPPSSNSEQNSLFPTSGPSLFNTTTTITNSPFTSPSTDSNMNSISSQIDIDTLLQNISPDKNNP
ncbi:hypothetical protein BDF20DRAFT_909217 [Mycotypha africana]|uniref:uncharacterized protein n=1 Tax=Mycotypha africana TaxID=64632 RepID=UPI002301A8B7|nr:uncharacterized protein BDF20DRAFT_909217 [Mycotypha africana]KAI8991435.1 hypothetical protein BDF20DRAFT_909217 [Mycotypha africana]